MTRKVIVLVLRLHFGDTVARLTYRIKYSFAPSWLQFGAKDFFKKNVDHLAFIFPVGSEDRENKKSSDWRKPYERQTTCQRSALRTTVSGAGSS